MCDAELGTTIPICSTDCESAFTDCGMLPDDCSDTRVFSNIGEAEEVSCDPE